MSNSEQLQLPLGDDEPDDLLSYALGGTADDEEASTDANEASKGSIEDNEDPFGSVEPSKPTEQASVQTPAQAPTTVARKAYRGMDGMFIDEHENIVDANGEVVAAAGKERRFFEGMSNFRDFVKRKDEYISQLESHVEAISKAAPAKSELDQVVETFALEPRQAVVGLQIANMWKRDPANALAYLFAEARKLGYNDTQLGSAIQNYNPANDPNAMQEAVRQAVNPILKQVQQALPNTQPQAVDQSIQTEVTRVFAKYPGADIHQEVLAKMLNEGRANTLEEAVTMLYQAATSKGLDFYRPLAEQLAERNTQPIQQPAVQQYPSSMYAAPAVTPMAAREQYASPDQSFASIIRSAMQSARQQP
jgi:hypothetical protein